MNTYLIIYLCSWLMALLITPFVIKAAHKFKAVDSPNIRKIHSQPVPRIGGVAIFVPMIFLTLCTLFVRNVIGDSFRDIRYKIIILLGAATFMFIVGLIDDTRGLRARTKLLCQLLAAFTVCFLGIRINSIAVTDWFVLNLGWFSWVFTILWIVGVVNAINLIDGLDGLAAGISAITCAVIVILSIHFHQSVMAVMMLSLLGALTGFLFFNFNPAKIFMGDSGSLFLGFIIATSSVLCAAKTQTVVGLALPVLALGIPIFDTLVSMLRRFIERRSMFSADRSHFHHQLLNLGISHRHAVISAYIVTLFAAGLGMFMLVTRSFQTVTVFCCILLLLLLVFRVIGSVKLREVVDGLKKKRTIANNIKREKEDFEKIQLHFSHTKTFDQWWQSVCLAADRMRFATISMDVKNRDGTKRSLAWQKEDDNIRYNELAEVTMPVRDRRSGPPLRMAVSVHTNGSLESAGRRLTLFARLLEECGVANLSERTMVPAGAGVHTVSEPTEDKDRLVTSHTYR